MVGAIIAWSGTLLDIPIGWQLCDGSNGTPDLRGRFIEGAGPANPVDGTGGSVTHDHNFTGGGHDHEFESDEHDHDANNVVEVQSGTGQEVWDGSGSNSSCSEEDVSGTTDSGDADGTTDVAGSRPLFWTLAWIQRMV